MCYCTMLFPLALQQRACFCFVDRVYGKAALQGFGGFQRQLSSFAAQALLVDDKMIAWGMMVG